MSDPSEMPGWLRIALRNNLVGSEEFREDRPADLLSGDIVVIGPYEDANARGHLFVVVDAEYDHCNGMLAVAETERAVDVDAVLTPETTGLGYPLAVLTRFRGTIWSHQVRQRVGAIEIPVLEELERLSWSDEPSGFTLRRGLPLLPGDIDPRYPVRRALSLEFDRLTEHYRRRQDMDLLDSSVGEVEALADLFSQPDRLHQIKSVSPSQEFRDGFVNSYSLLDPDQQRAALSLVELTLREEHLQEAA